MPKRTVRERAKRNILKMRVTEEEVQKLAPRGQEVVRGVQAERFNSLEAMFQRLQKLGGLKRVN